MENLLSFYNTLFSIEITIFGTITAVIFVLIQIIYSGYPSRQIFFILKNRYLIVFFISSVFSLIFTAIASWALVFQVPITDPPLLMQFITNKYYGLGCIVFVFLMIISVSVFVIKNFEYLNPSRILLLSMKDIDYIKIRNILLKKYGIMPPENPRDITEMDILMDISPEENTSEKTELRKKSNGDYPKDLEKYHKLKDKVKNVTDPLVLIDDIAVRSIQKYDLKILGEINNIYCQVSENFISNIPASNGKTWNPNHDIKSKYCSYLLEHLKFLLEVCNQKKSKSANLIILEISKNITDLYIKYDSSELLFQLSGFWKEIADNSIQISPDVFKKIILFYRETIESLMEEYDNKSSLICDNLFREIGWLGERLLSKEMPEKETMMMEWDYKSEYDVLFDSIMEFGSKYDQKYPDKYPLLFFGAVYVIINKIIDFYENYRDNSNLKEGIYNLSYIFYSFAINAINAGNSDGAGLAIIRLRDICQILYEKDINIEAQELLGDLVKLALLSAAFKKNLNKSRSLGESNIDDWFMNELLKFKDKDTIEIAVRSAYPSTIESADLDSQWDFITKLGLKLETNFGFMFDWETGVTYPEDDQRRH